MSTRAIIQSDLERLERLGAEDPCLDATFHYAAICTGTSGKYAVCSGELDEHGDEWLRDAIVMRQTV